MKLVEVLIHGKTIKIILQQLIQLILIKLMDEKKKYVFLLINNKKLLSFFLQFSFIYIHAKYIFMQSVN